MTLGFRFAAVAMCVGALASSCSQSKQAQAPIVNGAGTTAAAPRVDPDAVAALTRMGAFLREQKTFAVRSRSQTDEILASGQKVQLTADAELNVRRPNRLRAEVRSDRKQRQFFYDGETFTINAPRMGYYATVPAPATLGELVVYIDERFGIDLPLADLFYWGTDRARIEALTSAIYVGPSTVDGIATDHFAFRQPGLDWQLWIERGDRPLPRKLVLTTTDEPAQPQHVVTLDWNLDPKQSEGMFTFKPPKSAFEIAIAERPPSEAEDEDEEAN